MKKILLLLTSLSVAAAGASYKSGNQFPSSCGSNGLYLQANGDCTSTWNAVVTTSPTTLLTSTNTWSANQSFFNDTFFGSTTTAATPHLKFTAPNYQPNAVNVYLEPGGDQMNFAVNGVNEWAFRSDQAQIKFGSGDDVGIHRIGAAALKITDGAYPGNGYGTLLFSFPSQTKAQIMAITPGLVGQTYYCSDCATVALCTSTGTVAGAFSLITNKGSTCN